MYIYEMTAVGIDHEHQGTPCEDHVTTFQWGSVVAEVCADGADEGSLGGAEAKRLSETLAQFMAMYFRQLRQMPEDQLQGEILRVIRGVQADVLAERGAGAEALGCTVVAAAMDRRSHEYLGVSLGDGILLAREHLSGMVCTILPPQRRENGGAWLTSDDDETVRAHIRSVRGRSKDALMVSSSGLEDTLWDASGRTLSPTVGKLMNWVVEDPEGVRTDFTELVYDLSLPDDAGVAVMVDRRVRLGDYEGKDPTMMCQRRRSARRYRNYLRYRDAGMSRREAAFRAGWGWADMHNVSYLRAIGAD